MENRKFDEKKIRVFSMIIRLSISDILKSFPSFDSSLIRKSSHSLVSSICVKKFFFFQCRKSSNPSLTRSKSISALFSFRLALFFSPCVIVFKQTIGEKSLSLAEKLHVDYEIETISTRLVEKNELFSSFLRKYIWKHLIG